MAEKQTFEVVLEQQDGMNATGITIPFDVEAIFGAKRVPVKASIKEVEYRASIVRMGGNYYLGISKAFRDAAGLKAGDNIVVTLERDTEPRAVTPPNDFTEALSKTAEALANWEKLSYTLRKEFVQAIGEAKKPETRIRRIEKAVQMIAAQIK